MHKMRYDWDHTASLMALVANVAGAKPPVLPRQVHPIRAKEYWDAIERRASE